MTFANYINLLSKKEKMVTAIAKYTGDRDYTLEISGFLDLTQKRLDKVLASYRRYKDASFYFDANVQRELLKTQVRGRLEDILSNPYESRRIYGCAQIKQVLGLCYI